MRRISDIGAAVIGSGFIGTVHIEALRRLGVPIHGLLEASPERGAKRVAELGLPHAYESDGRAARRRARGGRPRHLAQRASTSRRCARSWPPGSTSSARSRWPPRRPSPRSWCASAAETGVVNAVNFNIRFYPLNQHLAQLVAGGELGEIRLVTGHYFQDWLLLDTDWNWRLDPAEGGRLRAVGDIGSHWLDLASFVGGLRIESVMADLATFVKIRHAAGRAGGDLLHRARGEHDPARDGHRRRGDDPPPVLETGRAARSRSRQVSAGRKNSLQYEIDGSVAAAAWDSERPDELWLGRRERPNELLIRNPALMTAAGTAAASLPGGHVEGFADTFKAHFRAVYADVAAGGPAERPIYPTFADGHDEMLVNDAVATSAREGRWVAVTRS